MEYRALGRTGLVVSELGFGCGNIGGLMVRGTAADQERAVARAIELGVNYFDTAPMYGDTLSETNLGRVLSRLRPDIVIATKASADPARRARLAEAIAQSCDASLRRLGRERVDVFQLHTAVTHGGRKGTLELPMVVEEVVPAFEALRRAGKIGYYGFSGTGDADLLPELVGSGAFDAFQVIYNLINPSAGTATYPPVGPDYRNVLATAAARGMGAVGIRVLAGGALSGSEQRHPVSASSVAPMGTSADYAADVERAARLSPLISEGHVATLTEAALRFALSQPAISTALVGFSDLSQIEEAALIAGKGALPTATLSRISELLSD